MTTFVISNTDKTTIIARDFESHRDAITWCQNTQDMSQEWLVDSLHFIVTLAYKNESES